MKKGLTIKEKCLYLIKVSKRRNGVQALVVTGLALAAMGVNYFL